MTVLALNSGMDTSTIEPSAERKRVLRDIDAVRSRLDGLPLTGFGRYARIDVCLLMLLTLERIQSDQDADPYPQLEESIAQTHAMADAALRIAEHTRTHSADSTSFDNEHEITEGLFETAWTTYGEETYDHSLTLVEERLSRSGFDASFFDGKTCFDGGCGTGRVAIAMAKAGAKKVIAADLGQDSLDYLDRTAVRFGLHTIETVRQDITDLSRWPSNSFDFVVSNGVLHHTPRPDQGLREHFRITAPGGIFWLYLYGAGGLYWDVYDHLKPLLQGIEPPEIRKMLTHYGIREGLIYTFLDNFLAPRVYYSLDRVLDLLGEVADFTYAHASGRCAIDDTQRLLKTKYGQEIFGPQGEVRIAVTKSA